MNIIQTWKDENMPGIYKGLSDKVKFYNPNWNYMFFTDTDIDQFIQTKMPQHYSTFENFKQKIQQLDYFRYLAIYYYGGVYLDLDMNILDSLDDLYNTNPEFCKFPIELTNITDTIINRQNFTHLIGNYAFYAPPKHPFIKRIIDNIDAQRIHDDDIKIAQSENTDPPSQVYVYCTTGPVLVTQTYIDNSNLVELLIPTPINHNCFGNYGMHLSHGNWKA
uniref:Glycosyltransferase n=1 Tax=viral metagenome TaxID=1070528 RepID=A0A6C0J0J7_9ZZZZ